jgi:MFS family permease
VLGLLLLSWLFGYMRSPGWHPGRVVILVTVYFFVAQLLPLAMVIWRGVRFNKEHKRSLPDAKRTAVLQRRGLFDFVSKSVVSVAVLGYFLFAAFAIYIRRDPIGGNAGLIILGAITLVYALTAFVIYTMLYGRKGKNTLDTHADRLQAIGVTVKSSVYACIVIAVFLSLNLSLRLLNLQKWEPLALSTFFLICALLSSMGVTATLRRARVIDRPT